MRQVSDLRKALDEEVARLQAAPGLERRVLDGAFRPAARGAATPPAPAISAPRSFRATAMVAVLVTVAILVAALFGAYKLAQPRPIPGSSPFGVVETTAPIALNGPRAFDCVAASNTSSSCDMQPPVFANALIGWLAVQVGNPGSTSLYRTDDGGRHWKNLISWDCDGLSEIETSRDGREALVVIPFGLCDGGILHTTDAGAHWTSYGVPSAGTRCLSVAGNCTFGFRQIQFLNPKAGWLFVQGPTILKARLFRTDDSGAHWVLAAEIDMNAGLANLIGFDHTNSRLFFTSSTDGWIVEANRSYMYRTRDGGKTWQEQRIAAPGLDLETVELRALRFFGANDGVLYISSGTQLYVTTTSDGGNTWTSPRDMPGTPSLMNGFPALAMVDARTWYTVSQAGLLRTSDAGYTWTTVNASPPGCCWLVFYDVQHGFLLSDQLYQTTDGGAHWTAFPVPVEGGAWSFAGLP